MEQQLNNILPRGILVAQFIEDANRLTDGQLSEKYDVSFRTLRRWKQKIRESEEDIAATVFPESPTPRYTDFLKLEAKRVIILGDCEIPDQDAVVFQMVSDLATRLGVETLIVNGDFMAMDSFSAWPKQNMQFLNFNHDLDLAIQSLKAFLNTFDSIYYLIGNHERRLSVHNRGEITLERYFKDMVGISYSNYTYAELISGGKEILVCHPEEYSRVPLAVPGKICSVHHKNVISGHTHRLCQGWDTSGKYFLVESGHARSEEQTAYKSFKMTSHPKWNAGFVLVINGEPYLIHKGNFDFWMNNVRL